jgi:hypothetical protein
MRLTVRFCPLPSPSATLVTAPRGLRELKVSSDDQSSRRNCRSFLHACRECPAQGFVPAHRARSRSRDVGCRRCWILLDFAPAPSSNDIETALGVGFFWISRERPGQTVALCTYKSNGRGLKSAGQKVSVDLQSSWAVTGSNRRPLRCKRRSPQTRHLLKRSFWLLRHSSRCREMPWCFLVLRPSAEQKRNKASTRSRPPRFL